MRDTTGLANLTVQFIERIENVREDVVTARRETVHTRGLGALRLRCAQPASRRHARQHRIQRARTQSITVVMQLLEHPVAINPLLGRVVENVDLPEREQELADDWIARHIVIITLAFVVELRLRRWMIDT
jgi:hypothetical protein